MCWIMDNDHTDSPAPSASANLPHKIDANRTGVCSLPFFPSKANGSRGVMVMDRENDLPIEGILYRIAQNR
jgi:hypothetical protein